jgi:hypothetical protein
MTSSSSGFAPTLNRPHSSSSSDAGPSLRTSSSSARTVSVKARSTQAASASPFATGATTSAARSETLPVRNASRRSGRVRSSFASLTRFIAVRGWRSSTSRA